MGKYLLAVLAATAVGAGFAAADDDARKKYVEHLAKKHAAAKRSLADAATAQRARADARDTSTAARLDWIRADYEKDVTRVEIEMKDARALLAANREAPVNGTFLFKKNPVTGAYTIHHDTEDAKAGAVKIAQEGVESAEKKLGEAKTRVPATNPPASKSDPEPVGEPPLVAQLPADGASISVGQIGAFVTKAGPMQGKVSKIVDEKNILVKTAKYLLWVETPSKGMADGKPFAFDGVYEVVGTKKHNTQTLYHLRPFALTDKELKAIRDAK